MINIIILCPTVPICKFLTLNMYRKKFSFKYFGHEGTDAMKMVGFFLKCEWGTIKYFALGNVLFGKTKLVSPQLHNTIIFGLL